MDMLLNFIVGRMNGAKYGAPEFYWWVSENLPEEDARPILDAIDSGCEAKVKQAIFEHFSRHQLYPLALHYVGAVNWLQDDPEQSNGMEYGTWTKMHMTDQEGNDKGEEYFEVMGFCQTDARLTLKRQVIAAYEQALRHGHEPWTSLLIDFPREICGFDMCSIRVMKEDRERVVKTYKEQHEKNRHLPAEEQKEAVISDVKVRVTLRNGRTNREPLRVERTVTLRVKHQHISAFSKEWYMQKHKG